MTLFGGDPGVVGRSIVLNGEARTIVGVMPPGFEWNVADLWIPGALSRADDPGLARCRTIRPRLAPSAARIVISRSRAVARASSMFATLQQANHEQQAHRRRSRPRGISLKKLSSFCGDSSITIVYRLSKSFVLIAYKLLQYHL